MTPLDIYLGKTWRVFPMEQESIRERKWISHADLGYGYVMVKYKHSQYQPPCLPKLVNRCFSVEKQVSNWKRSMNGQDISVSSWTIHFNSYEKMKEEILDSSSLALVLSLPHSEI